ncbi:MAG: hypothetical protein M1140_01385 [Chloroflexi bacterium]|nr:hypothetical protein [Chloroflexota bacterium]
MLTLPGKELWLDIVTVDLSDRFPITYLKDLPDPDDPRELRKLFYQHPTVKQVVAELSKRAQHKYKKKFKEAVDTGLLTSTGVLLCLLKSESQVIPQMLWRPCPKPPQALFDARSPGLEEVWVHTLRPREGTEMLEPFILWKWTRS